MFGLKQRYIDSIVAVLQEFAVVEKALVFGSRALEDYKKGSDVDIAIAGDDIDYNITARISYLLN